MKIEPLIFSRTEACEYFFAVRPDDFKSNNVFASRAREEITSLVNEVQYKNDRKFLVLSENGLCIAGIACIMKTFIEGGGLTPDEKADAKTYKTVDKGSRRYGVFLGYVFKDVAGEIPLMTDSDLWQMFKENLEEIWNDKSAKERKGKYFECKSKLAPVEEIESKTYCGITLYDDSKVSDKALFEKYLALAQKENVAFRSGADNVDLLKDKIFTAVSTSTQIIEILKTRHDKEQNLIRQKQEQSKQEKTQKELVAEQNNDINSAGTSAEQKKNLCNGTNLAEEEHGEDTCGCLYNNDVFPNGNVDGLSHNQPHGKSEEFTKLLDTLRKIAEYINDLYNENLFIFRNKIKQKKPLWKYCGDIVETCQKLEEYVMAASAFDKYYKQEPNLLNPTLQMLYDCEKHYMQLVRDFEHEINFIAALHKAHRQEVTNFYNKDLPAITEKLKATPISEEVQQEWIKGLGEHMQRSFDVSQKFIDDLTTKTTEEFNSAIKEKVFGGSV